MQHGAQAVVRREGQRVVLHQVVDLASLGLLEIRPADGQRRLTQRRDQAFEEGIALRGRQTTFLIQRQGQKPHQRIVEPGRTEHACQAGLALEGLLPRLLFGLEGFELLKTERRQGASQVIKVQLGAGACEEVAQGRERSHEAHHGCVSATPWLGVRKNGRKESCRASLPGVACVAE